MSLFIKVEKYAGCLLLVLIIIYIVTGFSYAGLFGFGQIINIDAAIWIHNNLYVVGLLIVLIILHCSIRTAIRIRRRLNSK